MTTAALASEQAPIGEDQSSLRVTAFPLLTVDSRNYQPSLQSEGRVLNPGFLSKRRDTSINDHSKKNNAGAAYGQLPELKPASANGIAPNIPSRLSITSVSSTTSTSAATESETAFPEKTSKPSKSNSKSKSFDKDDPRREKYLERNRRAASKCRSQKKARNQQLENLYHKQSAEHERLLSERDRMRSELLSLKDELLRHAQCKDPPLKLYIAQMVEEAGAAVAPSRPMNSYSLYFEDQAQPFLFDDDDALLEQSTTVEMPTLSDAPWTTLSTDFVDVIHI
jgi:hypothetical protein